MLLLNIYFYFFFGFLDFVLKKKNVRIYEYYHINTMTHPIFKGLIVYEMYKINFLNDFCVKFENIM